jgi:hypothetical protein
MHSLDGFSIEIVAIGGFKVTTAYALHGIQGFLHFGTTPIAAHSGNSIFICHFSKL